MADVDLSKYSDEEIINGAAKVSDVIGEQAKQTKWKHEPSLRDLKEDFEGAKNDRSAFITSLNKWNELYEAPKFGSDDSNRSRVNIKLIRKQVEWRCPALSEPFLSTNNLYEVKALTFEDVARAKQNSLILNRQFNTQLDKVDLVDKIVRKVVKDGSAVARLGWKFKEVKVKEKVMQFEYMEASEEEAEQLAQQYEELAQMQVAEPDSYEQLPEELKAGMEMSMEEGTLLIAMPAGEVEEEVTKTIVNKPTVEVCDIRNVYIDPTCNGDISNAQFIIYSYESSLSDLKKDGNFKNLDKLKEYEESDGFDHNNPSHNKSFKFKDEARKKIIVYEYWGYRDIDGSGETTSFTASWVGSTIIRMEENPFPDAKPPFVMFNYIPEEDSVYGIPDAELLGDNQELLSAITRGMIDIMGKNANGQTGISKNFLDVSNQIKYRNGDDYFFNPGFDPRAHIHTHSFPEIPNSAMQMTQLLQNDSEAMSGIKAFGQDGLTAVNFGNTATGVRGVLDAVSKRELSILRRISEGFKDIGRKIISMNSEFLAEEEVVRVTNSEFITVRRDDLQGDYDLTLTISTAEADNAKAEELAFMLQTMGETMGQEVMKTILVEIATLRKMPDLAKKIEEYEPAPDPFQEQMQELELAYKQAEVAKLEAEAQEIQAKAMVYQAKVAVEEARASSLEGDAGNKALDFAERNTGTKQKNELEKQDAINAGNLQAQEAKALGDNQNMKDKHNMDLMRALADKEMEGDSMGMPMPEQGLPNMDMQAI